MRELEGDLEDLSAEKTDAREAERARSLVTTLGERMRLGGKAEILFIDSQSERDPIAGSTDNPEPRFEIDVLRLEPRFDINREISVHSQIDFKPRSGRTVLKEFTVRHRASPLWWLRSDARLGLDDRFIRLGRGTESYPLVGTAFWRDESVHLLYSLSFGKPAGPPLDEDESSATAEVDQLETLTSGSEDLGRRQRERMSGRPRPFDFAFNPGQVKLHFSVGNGYSLDGKEVGFDRADFNDMIQDDRDVSSDLSIREVGLGIGYDRSFVQFGRLSVLGFFYDDELDSDSQDFLQDDLTVRDIGGNPVSGYGDSNSDKRQRYGASFEYFLAAEYLYGSARKTRKRDGLRLLGQWMEGDDGKLNREGWFVQASFRFSLPDGLISPRYFRSFEPVVRYGELDTNISPDPQLPGTWDREAIMVGMITEIARRVHLRTEYTFHDESTGGSDVSNNDLAVALTVRF